MATATFNGTVIADSDDIVTVEGNAYFPADAVDDGFLRDNDMTSVCPWKGTASYKDVVVDDQVAAGGAWFYPTPKDAAEEITGRYAFWNGVEVTD